MPSKWIQVRCFADTYVDDISRTSSRQQYTSACLVYRPSPLMKTPGLGLKCLVIDKIQLSNFSPSSGGTKDFTYTQVAWLKVQLSGAQ